MNNPKVSIIIPTNNRSHLLGETLESVIGQTYTNWECLVIDDGSEDYTGELMEFYIEKDFRIQYMYRPQDRLKGANTCRNYGFELSRGEFMNWFDSDDVMLPYFLERKMNLFEEELMFIIGGGYFVNEKLEIQGRMEINPDLPLFKGIILGKQKIITNSVLFRRSFLEGKKLFNPDIHRGQETEFFSRLFFKVNTQSYRIINKPLFLYRQHFDSKTASDKIYVKKFKESTGYIAANNLRRSISINDTELILHYYKILVIHFLKGLENDHRSNSIFVFKRLLPLLWKINKRLFFEFMITGSLLLTINRVSYRFGKRLREYKLFKQIEDNIFSKK